MPFGGAFKWNAGEATADEETEAGIAAARSSPVGVGNGWAVLSSIEAAVAVAAAAAGDGTNSGSLGGGRDSSQRSKRSKSVK